MTKFIQRFEGASDTEIIHALNNLRNFEGDLIVVTDASYLNKLGPFLVNADDIINFVTKHGENFYSDFLDTDVIIVSLESNLVWVVHHEGVYGLIDYNI